MLEYLTDEDLYGTADAPESASTEVQPERGFWGDLRTSALRGLSGIAGSVGEIGDAVGFENDWQEDHEARMKTSPWLAPDYSESIGAEGFWKSTLSDAVEAAPASLGPAIAGGGTGAAIGSVFGPGGTAVGGVIGALGATLGFFGVSEGQKAKEAYLLENPGDIEGANKYGIAKGLTEGGGETLAMAFDLATAGTGKLLTIGGKATIKAMMNRGWKQIAKDSSKMAAKIQASEQTTELGQLELGNKIDQEFGMVDRDVTWEERLHTVGVTMWMAGAFGAGSIAYNAAERSQLKKDIESSDPVRRNEAHKKIYVELSKEDQGLADDYSSAVEFTEGQGINIVLNENIVDQAVLARSITKVEGAPEGDTASLIWSPAHLQDNAINKILDENNIPNPSKSESTSDKQTEAINKELNESLNTTRNEDNIKEALSGPEERQKAKAKREADRASAEQSRTRRLEQLDHAKARESVPVRPTESQAPELPLEPSVTVTPNAKSLVPLKLIMLTQDRVYDKTGEVVNVTQRADKALEHEDAEVNKYYEIRECLIS